MKLLGAALSADDGPQNERRVSWCKQFVFAMARQSAADTPIRALPLVVHTGSTLALTKIGDGVQTLGGSSSYTGATLVSAGTLLVNGALGNTAVTVANDARIGGGGTIGGSIHFNAGADFVFSTSQTLTINGTAVTFGGFSIADLTGLSNSVADGVYTLIDGTATVSPANLANIGIENSQPLGNNKFAFFEIGSLKVHVIPEPGVAWLGGLGLLALLRRRRA